MTMYDHVPTLYMTMFEFVLNVYLRFNLFNSRGYVQILCLLVEHVQDDSVYFKLAQNGSNDFKKLKSSSLFSNYAYEILTLFNLMHLCKNFVLVFTKNRSGIEIYF